jgi:tripartite-type tricarboxylate transporter receptor subunit TctC
LSETVAPDIPTFAESGLPNFNVSQWYALFAPAGTPKEVLDNLTKHARVAMKSADVSEKLKSVGTEQDGSSAEDLRVFLAVEVRQWAEVAQSVDVKIQ